jgi:hypothetical protein
MKNIGAKIKEGVGNVVEFCKKIINTFGVKKAINIGTSAFGVSLPICDLISTVADILQAIFLGPGAEKEIYSKT